MMPKIIVKIHHMKAKKIIGLIPKNDSILSNTVFVVGGFVKYHLKKQKSLLSA